MLGADLAGHAETPKQESPTYYDDGGHYDTIDMAAWYVYDEHETCGYQVMPGAGLSNGHEDMKP